ncbi:MAG: hypothetical protein WCO09_04670, partial [bacterium]
IGSEPTLVFLREHGFEGNPENQYSLDIVTAESEKGGNLFGQKTFNNYEDLQSFIRDNPDAIARKDLMDETGVAPYKISYGQSVYDWSGKLSPEKSQELTESFDRFADKTMDARNFKKNGNERTPDEVGREISRTETQLLSRLDNPEMLQTVGEQNEVIQIIKAIAYDARRPNGLDESHLAGVAVKDLMRISECLASGSTEELLKADQVLAGYINRSMSQMFHAILNDPDISVPWDDKEKMMNILKLGGKILARFDGVKTRDLLSQERQLGKILEKYQPKDTMEKPDQIEGRVKENPLKKILESRDLMEALNVPSVGYTERKGVSAVLEVFSQLYPDFQQMSQKLESLINDYRIIIENSVKNNSNMQDESHRLFASKKVLESLPLSERQALENFLDKNYLKMGGAGQRWISIDLPFGDFLSFVERPSGKGQ